MGHKEHEQISAKSLRIGVLTLSDTRNEDTDKSGQILKELLLSACHTIQLYKVIKEDPINMNEVLSEWLISDVDAIITNGGTGLTSRDGTVEVVRKLFSKELEGFGEIFRLISYHQIGAAAMLSRATAGLAKGKIIICLPGSSKAVMLAAKRLIIPQLAHMVWEANR